MATDINEKEIAQTLISLIGKNVDVGIISSGERLNGTIVNAMFDSFLIESNGETKVVQIRDLAFLEPIKS